MSYLYNGGKLGTDHVINSTIATGIAFATSSEIYRNPLAGLIIGWLAGALSVTCYQYLMPKL